MRKLFKKALACCLVAALALTCFVGALSVNAETAAALTGKIEVGTVEVANDATTATVPVVITSDNALNAAKITVAASEGWEVSAIAIDAASTAAKIEADNINGDTFIVEAFDNVAGFTTATVNVTFTSEAAVAATITATLDPVHAATWNEDVVNLEVTDGAITVKASEPEGPKTITSIDNSNSLDIQGTVQIRQYIAFDGLDMTKEEVIENGGLIVWKYGSKPANDDEAIINTGDSYTVPFSDNGMYAGKQEYVAVTEGIPAAEYAIPLNVRPYVIIDGEYYYGSVLEISVKAYCARIFNRTGAAANEALKEALVGLLNYGAAAQTFFDVDSDSLVNADLQSYVDKGLLSADYLKNEYSDSLITDIVPATSEMSANFVKDIVTDNGNSCDLQGAICLNQYFGVGSDAAVKDSIVSKTMYVWNGDDYDKLLASGTALTKDNASDVIEVEKEFTYGGAAYGYELFAATEGIPAAEISNTVYIAFCAETADGVEYCSGVVAHSPEEYALSKINNSKTQPTLVALLKAMVVYGDLMHDFFA